MEREEERWMDGERREKERESYCLADRELTF